MFLESNRPYGSIFAPFYLIWESQVPKTKLTMTAVSRLEAPTPSGKQALHWDTELKGFGVLCSGKTNGKSYVVQRDIDGKTRRVTVGPVNVLSLEKARERAQLVLADMYRGIDPKAKRGAEDANAASLESVLESYLNTRKVLRPKTAKDYRSSVQRYLGAWLDKPLGEITPEMVEERHQAILKEVARRGRSSLAKGHSAANGTMRVLRVLWNYAAERNPDLPENPVKRLRRAWYPEQRREGLVKASDLPAFCEAVMALPNPVHRDYLLAILFTGLRRGEAASLRWEDVDLEERIIRLPATRTKSGRRLDLPMSDFLHKLFTSRLSIGREGPYVFPADSKSRHIEEPRFALDAIERDTGIKVTIHDLRRTFITVAESCNISYSALKGLVNHSMGNDVTAGYVIAGPERLREPMQTVTDKMRELGKLEVSEGPSP
jgi:integrase